MSAQLSIVEGPGKYKSVYLNGYRIAGIKPWGGGKTILNFDVKEEDIMKAMDIDCYDTTQCPGDCDECTLYKETEKMMSQEQAEIKELKSLIENVWREYWHLQEHYRKLTGRDYMWLR